MRGALPFIRQSARGFVLSMGLICATCGVNAPAGGQTSDEIFSRLTNHVQALGYRLPVGEPGVGRLDDGPKALAAADFDGDLKMDIAVAATDGSVAVFFGLGDGTFDPAMYLHTVAGESLRGLLAADLNGDGRADLAVAAPFQGRIFVFTNQCSGAVRDFAPASFIEGWRGVRNLAAGDFDGDGRADLVAAGPNLGLRQYRSAPGGRQLEVADLNWLSVTNDDPERFPKPVYSMKSFRPPGAGRDFLAVTHAETRLVWILEPNSNGVLSLRSTLTNQFPAHGLAIGPIRLPAASGTNDLISVGRDAGRFEMRPAGSGADAGLFAPDPKLAIPYDVPGGPRAVAIVDLNRDGWNDLVVVQRNLDSVLTYANSNGVLVAISEQAVGASPRDLVAADLNGDGRPDAVVLNRDSRDLSVLLGREGQPGFRSLDHLYPVDGNVVGLSVLDFNHDGLDDVVQLHRASGDFSVRLSTTNNGGGLLPPVYYTVGDIPATLSAGTNLVFTANLGTERLERGSVSFRYANGDGTFGPEQRIDLPEDSPDGRLFALVPGDFDGDGNIDLAAGFLDSRLVFFAGSAAGEFTAVPTRPFVPQARGLVAADLDGDGDLDLAGVGVSGEVWVMANPGTREDRTANLLNTLVAPVGYPAPTDVESFGARKILAADYDGDGVMDLIVGSGKGAWLYRGLTNGGATNFVTPPRLLAGLANYVSDLLFEDLDLDGNKDLVISCRGQDCLTILKGTSKGAVSGLPLDAPATKFIATGDLDGDGKPDLVGTGRVLWTALSSRAPRPSSITPPITTRSPLSKPVINEILAINTEWPVEGDGNADFVELFGGGPSLVSLRNWKLSLLPEGEDVAKTFSFPPSANLLPGQHLLVIFSESVGSYHTGFRLSGDGGWLRLTNASGELVDAVQYPPQRPNISYARYRDGLSSFVFNPFPSPGAANPVNGTVEPLLAFAGADPGSLQTGKSARLWADVADDVGVSSLILYYQRLDRAGGGLPRASVVLQDSGSRGSHGGASRRYVAELPLLPDGAEIEFYFELTDLNDQVIVAPEEAQFTTVEAEGNAYQLVLGSTTPPPVEISELVADNVSGLGYVLADGTTNSPDWIEVRNISRAPVAMRGLELAHQIGENSRYYFPAGLVLQPGQHYVVFCDDRLDLGDLHAPFRLDRSGDRVMLTGTNNNRSRVLFDWLDFGTQAVDRAWARLGAGGPFREATPTPGGANVASVLVDGQDRGWLWAKVEGDLIPDRFAFPTQPGVAYVVRHSPTLSPPSWTTIEQFVGTGIEHVFRPAPTNGGFYSWGPAP